MKSAKISALGISLVLVVAFLVQRPSPVNRCDLNVGDKVQFTDTKILSQKLEGRELNFKRYEFETTAEYLVRLAEYKSGDESPVLVEIKSTEDLLEYDADSETFTFPLFALEQELNGIGNIFGAFNDNNARDYFNEMRIVKPYNYSGIVLQQRATVIRTYEEVRSLENTIIVDEIHSEEWGVYDLSKGTRKIPNGRLRSKHWLADAKVRFFYPFSNRKTDHQFMAIKIDVPRNEARKFKSNAKFGLRITPNLPFFSSGSIENPQSKWRIKSSPLRLKRSEKVTKGTTHIIFADVLCAVITDGDGNVARTIAPA